MEGKILKSIKVSTTPDQRKIILSNLKNRIGGNVLVAIRTNVQFTTKLERNKEIKKKETVQVKRKLEEEKEIKNKKIKSNIVEAELLLDRCPFLLTEQNVGQEIAKLSCGHYISTEANKSFEENSTKIGNFYYYPEDLKELVESFSCKYKKSSADLITSALNSGLSLSFNVKN